MSRLMQVLYFGYNNALHVLIVFVNRNRAPMHNNLAKIGAIAHLALPVGPGCYYPPRALIHQLLENVQLAHKIFMI